MVNTTSVIKIEQKDKWKNSSEQLKYFFLFEKQFKMEMRRKLLGIPASVLKVKIAPRTFLLIHILV